MMRAEAIFPEVVFQSRSTLSPNPAPARGSGKLRARAMVPVLLATMLAGCSFAPHYQRPDAPVAADWPAQPGVRYQGAGQGAVLGVVATDVNAVAVDELGWRDMFRDPQLQVLIARAFAENRDLRIAVNRIEEARALYGIQRGEQFPSIGAGLQGNRTHVARDLRAPGASSIASQYQAGIGLTRFEIDVFGRLKNLSEAAREQYLATEEARRSVHINLVGAVAQAYFNWRAARIQLDLTQRTLTARQVSYDLVRQRVEGGVAGELDLHQAAALLEQAAADLAGFGRLQAQAANALTLLVGTVLPDDLPEPAAFTRADQLARVAPGLPASLIERRPDILAAEAQLRAANANIGAARAAFFPSISLTGLLGVASPSLSRLFAGGAGTWNYAPSLTAPIFAGGSIRAGLDLAQARNHIAVATYERSIQQAFREVADALAGEATFAAQIDALAQRERATERVLELSTLRYENGIDSYLQVQTAQVDFFNAQQALVQVGLAALVNRVELYKALGGGWKE